MENLKSLALELKNFIGDESLYDFDHTIESEKLLDQIIDLVEASKDYQKAFDLVSEIITNFYY